MTLQYMFIVICHSGPAGACAQANLWLVGSEKFITKVYGHHI